MKLYTHPLSPAARKVHGVIAHTGVQVERQLVGLTEGAHKKPEYLALNPNGRVPTLVDGELKLWESNAIACYVAGKAADSALWPRTEQRYDIMRWLFWEANHWYQAISLIVGQKYFNRNNPNQAIIDKGLADFRTLAGVLNGHLENSSFLSGNGLTVADFAVGVWLGYAPMLELPVSEFPRVGAWYQRLAALPAWSEVLPPKS